MSLAETGWSFETAEDIPFSESVESDPHPPPLRRVSLQPQRQHTADLSLKSSSWQVRGNGAWVPPRAHNWIVDSAIASSNDNCQSHRGWRSWVPLAERGCLEALRTPLATWTASAWSPIPARSGRKVTTGSLCPSGISPGRGSLEGEAGSGCQPTWLPGAPEG